MDMCYGKKGERPEADDPGALVLRRKITSPLDTMLSRIKIYILAGSAEDLIRLLIKLGSRLLAKPATVGFFVPFRFRYIAVP